MCLMLRRGHAVLLSAHTVICTRRLQVITSCNSTADELSAEFVESGAFMEHERVRTYPVFRFAGVEGTRVATVAFIRNGAALA